MNAKIKSVLAGIESKLSIIEEHVVWLIQAESRFRIGQRVEWSRRGRNRGFPSRKCAQRGTVRAVNGFSVVVQLDGIKIQRSFHHAFFNPVIGPKLF